MITERDLSEKFGFIWKQHFPLLNSSFMRIFNEGQPERINKREIGINENVRFDLTSELAFEFSNIIYNEKITIQALFLDDKKFEEVVKITAATIWKNKELNMEAINMIQNEIEDTKLIANQILEFIQKIKTHYCEFKPKVKGYGAIPDLIADISIDDMLFEIKTVNRNFRSSDLKQLFLYLALQQMTGENRWKYGGLYNPRRGTYCKFNIKHMIANLSGGKSPNEVFENLLNSFSRNIQIDTKF